MFTSDQYELLDFGDGRKLERFGPHLLDRPSPAALGIEKAVAQEWRAADARYIRRPSGRGHWSENQALSESWCIQHETFCLELKPTTFGHLGLFPEQAENWDWITRKVAQAEKRLKILNLFAYTGGSTLAAAAAGADVVHVDSAKSVVRWARRNAAASGLGNAPIRWITEDVRRFVQRELKRGKTYDAVILDPPSYGHGPKAEPWQIEKHLEQLLVECFRLIEPSRAFVLLTCHSPAFAPADMVSSLQMAARYGDRRRNGHTTAHPLVLVTTAGRKLPSGHVARWTE